MGLNLDDLAVRRRIARHGAELVPRRVDAAATFDAVVAWIEKTATAERAQGIGFAIPVDHIFACDSLGDAEKVAVLGGTAAKLLNIAG